MTKVNYSSVDNEFIKVFLWVRGQIEEERYDVHAEHNVINKTFWQVFFDQIAFLTQTDWYRYKIVEPGNQGEWIIIQRNPFDNSEEPQLYGSEQFMGTDEFKNDKFSFTQSNAVTWINHHKLSLEFTFDGDYQLIVDWFYKKKQTKSWFINCKNLLDKVFSLYLDNKKQNSLSRYMQTRRDFTNYSDLKVSKNVWDPELFADELTKRLLLLLRLKLYGLLEDEKSSGKVNITHPFSVFFLKATYKEDHLLPYFSYCFDQEQIINLRQNGLTDEDIQHMQSPEMMYPGQGVCGLVAKTMSFVYVSNWKTATQKESYKLQSSSRATFDAESRFIKENELYEWPLFESGKIKFVICLNRSGRNMLDKKIILDLQQLFINEWQKMSTVLYEVNEPLLISQYYKGELARMKGLYNHSFQQRFFAPIQILFNEIKSNDIRVKAVKKRITMYRFAVQAINQDMHNYIREAKKRTVDLDNFIQKDISQLFSWNQKYLEFVNANSGYGKIKFDIEINIKDIKIEVNQDIFEQAILQIVTNALEQDVFSPKMVYESPEQCKVSLRIDKKMLDGGPNAVISIKNNGNPIDPKILSQLRSMLQDIRENGLKILDDFQYIPISNRQGANTGTGLIFSAAVFSSITVGNRCGYIDVSSEKHNTDFKIILPIKPYAYA